ncbi:MAG TPA: ATP-binding protein [Tepidisphaeraceae bacterium]|jgi:serine/threonine-protein kinase RsbW
MGVADSNKRSGGNSRRRPARAARGSRPAAGKKINGSRKTSTNKPVRITIPSDFLHGRNVQKKILDEVAKYGFSSTSTFGIKLALEEALMNAIKHGNKLDPHKKVHIEAHVTPVMAEIIIEDEGPGFDRKCVPDPTLEENLQKCSGRGILLMEAYMNSVRWDHGGRRVRMVKKNEDDDCGPCATGSPRDPHSPVIPPPRHETRHEDS